MGEKTTGAPDTVRGCLGAAAAFLLLDLLLRSVSLSSYQRWPLDLLVLPFALGLMTGLLVGPRWQHPMRASVLLAVALAVADTVPYTIDTIAMAHESDESMMTIARESKYANRLARETPSEIRAMVVKARILVFPYAVIIIGGPAVVGALAGRRLRRGRRPRPGGFPPAAAGASA